MAVQTKTPVTVAEFEAFIQLPEHWEQRFELLDGEIVEVPSNPFVSMIAIRITLLIGMYLLQNELQGYITGEGGSFIIDGQIMTPDAAYLRDLPAKKGFGVTPPVLAVEVVSDPHSNTEQTDLRRKLGHYMRGGVVVWIVDYVTRQVEIHVPGQGMQVMKADDVINGGEVLPGFTLPVRAIFPDEEG